jgi:hypothetical protein
VEVAQLARRRARSRLGLLKRPFEMADVGSRQAREKHAAAARLEQPRGEES